MKPIFEEMNQARRIINPSKNNCSTVNLKCNMASPTASIIPALKKVYEAPPSMIPIMYSIDLTGLVVRNTILLICLSNDTFTVMSAIPPPITENKIEPMMILGQSIFDEIKSRGVITDSGINIVINMYVRGRLKNHLAYIFAIVIMFVDLIENLSSGS